MQCTYFGSTYTLGRDIVYIESITCFISSLIIHRLATDEFLVINKNYEFIFNKLSFIFSYIALINQNISYL